MRQKETWRASGHGVAWVCWKADHAPAAVSKLELLVLGNPEIRWQDGAGVALPTRKSLALLAYLAMAESQPQPRGKLAALLWERSAEEQARASLRQTLFSLRRALGEQGESLVRARGERVWVEAERIELDVRRFERLAGECDPEALEDALRLYRGEFMEGLALREKAFEDWLRAERTRLHERMLEVSRRLLRHCAEHGAAERGIPIVQHLLALDPLDEEAHRTLMTLYAAQGRWQAALAQYAACAGALERELGVEPDAETERLRRDVDRRRVQPTPTPTDQGHEGQARALEQEIRFCTARDGVRIAYATVGQGPPLVKAANWMNHLEFDWQSPVWRGLLGALAREHLLVRYDQRGNGLSDREVADLSFEAMVGDLETVVDAAGLERFALLGISQGCAVSVAYAVRHPERVTHLVLYGGYVRGWRRRGDPTELERRHALATLIRQGWGQENPAFRQTFTSLFIPEGTPEQVRWFNELQRVSATPEMAARLHDAFGDIDVSALLPEVRAPTLVLHSRHDAVAPLEQGRLFASSIPGARFASLESQNHVVLEQEPAFVKLLAELRSFLGVRS